MSLGPQSDGLRAFDAGRLFHIDGDGQPDSGLHVHPPTVEVEVVFRGILGVGPGVGAVEADYVAILVLDPDAAIEPAHAGYLGVHVEDPGADRAQKLRPHKAEDVVLVVKARGVEEHHLHEAGGGVGEPLQPQRLGQPGDGPKRTLEEAVLDGRAGFVCLVEEAPAEVDAAQRVLVFDRHLVELHVGPRVLDVGLHQRRALLNGLDQHLFASDGSFHQRGLFGGELVRLFVLRLLLCVRAGYGQNKDQDGEGDLPKRHVKLLGQVLPGLPLAASVVSASRG